MPNGVHWEAKNCPPLVVAFFPDMVYY
jgi:hypothetical protein